MDYPISVPSVGLVDGKFVDEDAVTGRQGSLIPADWGNAVTQELLAVIAEAGLEPDEQNNGQLREAFLGIIAREINELEEQMQRLPLDTSFIDVTALRAFNTTYTNNRPYEIEVALNLLSVAPGVFQAEVQVDGSRYLIVTSYAAVAGTGNGASFPVPPGKTYRFQGAANCTLLQVREKVKV